MKIRFELEHDNEYVNAMSIASTLVNNSDLTNFDLGEIASLIRVHLERVSEEEHCYRNQLHGETCAPNVVTGFRRD